MSVGQGFVLLAHTSFFNLATIYILHGVNEADAPQDILKKTM